MSPNWRSFREFCHTAAPVQGEWLKRSKWLLDHVFMRKIIKITAAAVLLLFVAVLGYGVYGYFDALTDSEELVTRAERLLAHNLGGASLGEERYHQLLAVQNPTFEQRFSYIESFQFHADFVS